MTKMPSATTHDGLHIGDTAPDFKLKNIDGNYVSLSGMEDAKGYIVVFTCNHCPYVIHVNEEIVRLAKEYQELGVSFVAISSNDVENYPDDSPEKMTVLAAKEGYTFPYLYDETQEVARAYDAACTPDFYVFDKNARLVYRGQLDGSRPNSGIPLTGTDLRTALDAVLVNRPVNPMQRPSAGCGIKWKR